MERRDLIKEQIEQLGKVLGAILTKFLGGKTEGNPAKEIQVIDKQLKEKLNIDIEEMFNIDKTPELGKYIKSETKLAPQHLELLSEYLQEIGETHFDNNNKKEAKQYLKKALQLLDIADKNSNSLSFTRIDKKAKIEDLLK
jgi:hypothetical protein